jgi:hypothetical protein
VSYEVSIRRADESEITREEIEAFADFHIQEGITGTNPKTGEVMTLGGEFAIWTGHPEIPNGVPFLYSRRSLRVSNPDELVLTRMRELARAIGARVQGEEGEYYDEDPPAKRRRGLFRRH